ncbi:F0F1 ATP synthase subunit delta [Glycomyces buryatensis]|uniref:ATP synthase subunit delta n=1 Tax=Glycomyces buryatensis TaxID=2570927 RepID=A0A4S8QQ99_9ACTN|nr:F0F1 ATP synthase subunit delta [Glycomyces buryatensis]THV42894.1 F0F1 ATP synthase subunit delta [Glycomyces buryatensis]
MSTTGRESTEAGRETLEAFASGATAEQVTECGEQLLNVTRFLVDQPRLRRALSDPAREADDREGLVRRLLADQVGTAAIDVVATLVKGRWGSPSELVDGCETLAISALLDAGKQSGTLANIEDQLFRFGRLVDGDLELSSVLDSSGTDPEGRSRLVVQLLDGKAEPETVKLAAAACYGIGGRGFHASLAYLIEAAAAARDEAVAYVTVATPIDESGERKLAAKLSLVYGRPVALKLTVDPEIVGGIRVQVGSELWDGTVSRRLDEARQALAGR